MDGRCELREIREHPTVETKKGVAACPSSFLPSTGLLLNFHPLHHKPALGQSTRPTGSNSQNGHEPKFEPSTLEPGGPIRELA